MDTVTYFYYSPQTALECGWNKTPTGVMSLVNPPFVANHGTVVGCTKSHHGIARGCAAKFGNHYWHGVSGVLPCDTDRGLYSITTAAAPDADEGFGRR
eukprot:7159896-Pyramimonas_sp.AAC.1